MKRILALNGSTRERSTNGNVIKAIAELAKEYFEITVFKGLAGLPHFNPDLDNEQAPEAVKAFREQLRDADGILICTPEYAMGVPGSLKNAIDWTVSSMEFSQKPTALITASSMGKLGHASLLETLRIIEANVPEGTQLLISHAKTKVNDSGSITDERTLTEVRSLLETFHKIIQAP